MRSSSTTGKVRRPTPPRGVILKIVLRGHGRGLISSRSIERACRDNLALMAISGDHAPAYTSIAKFVRELGPEIRSLFTQVLLACDAMDLIGREMFAIDGVKLARDASKESSGMHAERSHKAQRDEKAAQKILAAHGEQDEGTVKFRLDVKARTSPAGCPSDAYSRPPAARSARSRRQFLLIDRGKMR